MDKELLYKIATGQIEDPKLDIECDGETQTFEGRDARVFSFGALFGMKVESPETNVEVLENGN